MHKWKSEDVSGSRKGWYETALSDQGTWSLFDTADAEPG